MKKVFVLALAILALLLPLGAQTVESNLVDAVSLYSNGQYAKAQRILQTLSVASPESDAVWYYLAQTQLMQNDMPGAEASLEKAVGLDSQFVDQYFTNTPATLGGRGLHDVEADSRYHHDQAFLNPIQTGLASVGRHKFRTGDGLEFA